MAVNLFNLLDQDLSAETVERIASHLGESPARSRSALSHAISAVVCTLHQRTRTTAGATELHDLLRRGGYDGRDFRSLASIAGATGGLSDLATAGAPLAAQLFGTRRDGLVDWLASSTAVGRGSASSVVSLAVPLVLSVLGKQATQGNATLSAGAVADLLRDQAGPLGRLAPAGLASVLGVTQCGDVAPARVYTPPPAPAPVPVKESGMGWLRWLLPLLLLPLLFFALRSCRSEPVRQVEAPPLAPVPAAPAPAPAKVLIPQALSCGQSLDVAEGGIEQQLVGFIDDKAAAIDKDKWFSFDRLEFETDKADLMPVSGAQLKNIAEIMTCYPSLALKIGGYTDSTANAAYNLKLSQDRADNTMKALVALGVDPSRLSAEGYGEQFPVASNDTEEGRQKNRRIDVSVRKK